MPYEPTPHKEEIIQALREGTGTYKEIATRFGVSEKTVRRYEKQLKEPAGKKGGALATVLQPSQGAIIFTLGQHKILLNPQHLYDAYLYYQDIALRHDIDEDFSLALKDSMKFAWERLNRIKAEKKGVSITIEEES